MNRHRELIEAFFGGMSAGALPAGLMAEEFTAWTTSSGPMPSGRYLRAPALLRAVFAEGLQFDILSVTAEEQRAAAEVLSLGVFADGTVYRNNYLFMFHFRDGCIVSVAEHFDPRPVTELLIPRMQAALAAA